MEALAVDATGLVCSCCAGGGLLLLVHVQVLAGCPSAPQLALAPVQGWAGAVRHVELSQGKLRGVSLVLFPQRSPVMARVQDDSTGDCCRLVWC